MLKYRGYEIEQSNPYTSEWYAVDPDADYDWEGDPGAYYQCSGLPAINGSSIADVQFEIDNYCGEQ